MTNSTGKFPVHEEHVCPWWLCFTFDNPLRGFFQNPYKILKHYIKPGDSILDIGPGMGYFTFPMSEMTGKYGRVTALDIQEGMRKRLEKKIINKKTKNIATKLYDGNKFPLDEKYDFILLFWMFHEVNNKVLFIGEIESVMKDGAKIFIAEPRIHVRSKKFTDSIKLLTDAGFKIIEKPHVSLSRAVVMQKG